MSQPWLFGGLYTLLFLALVIGIAIWRQHQRRDRRPFPDQLKLLRGPGETQLKLVRAIEENSALHLCAALAAPLLAAALLIWITKYFSGVPQLVFLGVSLLALLAVLYFSARHLVAKIEESNNRYLGFFGERVVAEHLDPLKAQGFRVFHDVPCGDATAPFNIDHVVIGPSGVFAIETKTRRKGRSRAGFAAHEIIYDGQVLAYPWGEDRHGLDQAARQARWLGDWLASLLGRRPPVQPILAFPGWMIIRRGAGAVTVLNPKEIPAAVAPKAATALDARELDLIARQIESRCRDVEF